MDNDAMWNALVFAILGAVALWIVIRTAVQSALEAAAEAERRRQADPARRDGTA